MRLILILILIATFVPASLVTADSHQPVENLVSLTVSVSEDVDNDLLVVRMYAEHEAARQEQASSRVNADMAWALASAKERAEVSAQTLDYRTNPVYQDRHLQAWRTRQSLRLESTNSDVLTALMGSLQERLAIESIAYEVSDPVREAAEERLIAAAIRRFLARSELIATSFGRGAYSIVSVNIHTEGRLPSPVDYGSRPLAMTAEVASPAIEAGVRSVTVTASGTIELAP